MHFFALSVTTSLKIPGAVIPRRVFTRPGPEAAVAALQRYVRSWSTSRHGADIVSVPPQTSLRLANCGEPRAAPELAMFTAMRHASSRVSSLADARPGSSS